MKRSVRPLFSILLLIAAAGTLTFRVALRRGFASFHLETDDLAGPRRVVPVFNSTLLRIAAVDLSEAQSKHEIEQMLEGNFAGQGRYRTFASWRRFNHIDDHARSSRGVPIQLRSPKFYRYWLEFRRNLNDWYRNKRFHPEIMSDLIRLVKHPIDKHNGLVGLGKRYSSCAVVGNSGILLRSEYGEMIDSHEAVIRLNNARLDRFEHNVGSKTSISFINSNILHLCARREGCFCHPYGVNVPMIMYICQPLHFLDYALCNSSHKAPLLITDPRFDMLCARIVKYYSLKRFVEVLKKPVDEWSSAHDGAMFHYSSGMQAVMLALGICDKVSIFGFGKSASAKHHYHTTQKAELPLHDYEAEYDFYRDLVERPQRKDSPVFHLILLPQILWKAPHFSGLFWLLISHKGCHEVAAVNLGSESFSTEVRLLVEGLSYFFSLQGSSYCLLTLLSWPATWWRDLDTRETQTDSRMNN